MNMEYWKRFENTGKIEDYLSFVSCERYESIMVTGEKNQFGESLHAGADHTDRDSIKAVSRGRIR